MSIKYNPTGQLPTDEENGNEENFCEAGLDAMEELRRQPPTSSLDVELLSLGEPTGNNLNTKSELDDLLGAF